MAWVYTTPLSGRISQATAYSSKWNPRGLEYMWYAPWNQALQGLIRNPAYFIVYPQKPLELDGTKMAEIKLKKRFKDEGIAYDSADEISEDDANIGPNPPRALSARQQKIEERKAEKMEEIREEMKQLLLEDKEDLLKRKDKQKKEHKSTPSTESAATISDGEARTSFPDFTMCHVMAEPIPGESTSHSLHRGGFKCTHLCAILLAEIKTTPPRSYELPEGETRRELVAFQLQKAIADLAEYCATFFEGHPKATYVIAIAAAGPFWVWKRVNRGDPPAWNFLENVIVDKEDEIEWLESFQPSQYYLMGTPPSDAVLQSIAEEHLFSAVRGENEIHD